MKNQPQIPVPPSRVNSLEQVETALRVLTAQGYDTKPLWAEHNAWLASIETREATEADRRWATRAEAPSTLVNHFVNGQPEQLTALRAFAGRQYRLSPGQRAVLRDRYGFTPAACVELVNAATFPKEPTVLWSLTLKSAEHVDNRRRTRVLNEVVLCPASAFFESAATSDAARVETHVEKDRVAKSPKVTPDRKPDVFRLLSDYI